MYKKIQRAMKLVEDGVSTRRASKLCGVPRSTLFDKLSGRRPLRTSRSNFVLTNEEEANLVGHILLMRQGRAFSHHFGTGTGTGRIGKILARFWLKLGILYTRTIILSVWPKIPNW